MRNAISGIGILLASAICLLASAAPADAALTHVFASSFSSTQPRAIAVDQTSGSVYVLSTTGLSKYSSAGVPSNFSALGTNTIEISAPRTVAVDNSGGTNDGVIYVGREASGASVFLPNGEFAAEVSNNTFEEEISGAGSGSACAAAVDVAGNFYVMRASNGFTGTSFLDKFHAGEWIANSIPQQVWPISGSMGGYRHSPGFGASNFCKLALDGTSAIYTSNGEFENSGPIRKYAASVFSLGEPPFKTIDNGTTFTVDLSNNDLYSDRDSSIARFDEEGVLREVFATGEFERSAGIAINPQSGTAYVSVSQAGGSEQNEVRIYNSVVTPDIDEVAASGGQTDASISATIGTAGAGNVTGCTVEYGTSSSYGSSVPCLPDAGATPYAGPQQITAHPTGLSKETTYHYRVTATNANGVDKDVDRTFTTHNVADVGAEAPTDVTQTTATLNGSFTGNGEPTSYYFEWGQTPAYGQLTAVAPGAPAGSPTGHTVVSAPIEGLTVYGPLSTAYHFRLVATNGSGVTVGPDREFFSAPPDLPVITKTTATQISPTGATLSSMVNPGNGDTLYTFEYGPTSAYGTFTPISTSIGNDDVDHPVTSVLEGLTPATTYHYRVVATNFGGTTQGPDQTFTTPGPPRIESTSPSSVTETTARLTAQVVPNRLSTTYHFEYGASGGYGSTTAESASIGSDSIAHDVTAEIGGLSGGVTYHFRVVATNSAGTTAGPDQTLTTTLVPPQSNPPEPPGEGARSARRAS